MRFLKGSLFHYYMNIDKYFAARIRNLLNALCATIKVVDFLILINILHVEIFRRELTRVTGVFFREFRGSFVIQ